MGSVRLSPGCLLVAMPMLSDPNFARSVVLVLDHDETGSLGVILNRPSDIGVDVVLPDWVDASAPPAVMFQGGPVGLDSALAVGLLADPHAGFRPVHGSIGLVDLDALDLVGAVSGRLRVFVGYSGWGPDQLDAEVAEGAWLVLPSQESDLLAGGDLWRSVLRRQPAPVSWLANYPEDPSLN